MKVLVIAPHPDDETIGCGGALCLHSQRGDDVSAVFLTSGELGLKQLTRDAAWQTREAEARSACAILGIARPCFLRLPDWTLGDDTNGAATALAHVLLRERPELVYLPHPAEWHPDHKATFEILKGALAQQHSSVPQPQLRGYEVWTPLAAFQYVENISAVMPAKLAALREHVSQIRDWDYVRAVTGLDAFRGAMAGRCEYAEVFQELTL